MRSLRKGLVALFLAAGAGCSSVQTGLSLEELPELERNYSVHMNSLPAGNSHKSASVNTPRTMSVFKAQQYSSFSPEFFGYSVSQIPLENLSVKTDNDKPKERSIEIRSALVNYDLLNDSFVMHDYPAPTWSSQINDLGKKVKEKYYENTFKKQMQDVLYPVRVKSAGIKGFSVYLDRNVTLEVNGPIGSDMDAYVGLKFSDKK